MCGLPVGPRPAADSEREGGVPVEPPAPAPTSDDILLLAGGRRRGRLRARPGAVQAGAGTGDAQLEAVLRWVLALRGGAGVSEQGTCLPNLCPGYVRTAHVMHTTTLHIARLVDTARYL
jgi:hypothetical protein